MPALPASASHRRTGRTARQTAAALLLAATLGLAGCGGGISVGIGYGYDYDGYDDYGQYDEAPTVRLSLSTQSAGSGTTVRLNAQPDDDYGITQVDFDLAYPDGRIVSLGSVRRPPWQIDMVLPAGTGGSVLQLRARAWDDAGQSGVSPWIGLSVR
ncbi:hypothetical protein [Sphaerotilus sp.]|uniref:hypothetical protein n=1 Tax=Sphaerotilus sp. TaxID=2093942 RepID=UPI002ACEAD44|nr:hypothetical protein [Sphaerotilus sp.]MDZ7855220.1 hypothetical protein [Sphaerotilus sp.]